MVGDLEDFTKLTQEYLADKVYLEKIEDLKHRFTKLRRLRGDGNCFYRAFGFGCFEKMIKDTEECKK